jgi:hypothetical protein
MEFASKTLFRRRPGPSMPHSSRQLTTWSAASSTARGNVQLLRFCAPRSVRAIGRSYCVQRQAHLLGSATNFSERCDESDIGWANAGGQGPRSDRTRKGTCRANGSGLLGRLSLSRFRVGMCLSQQKAIAVYAAFSFTLAYSMHVVINCFGRNF